MKEFMNDDLLLETDTAKALYHNYAKDMPIIDYHCHLDPKEIFDDLKFENITQAWLYGDHYKWRAMRSCGIEERYITGDASDYDKFIKWAHVLPQLIGNPLYHWTHLELKKYFDYSKPLSSKTADEVWHITSEKLKNLSARKMISSSNVESICTTDDPTSDLKYHMLLKQDTSFSTKVLPAFRPDKALNIDKDGFLEYINSLSEVADMIISSFADIKQALENRIEYFNQNGCTACDHGLDYIMYNPITDEKADEIFAKVLNSKKISPSEADSYKTALFQFLAKEYHKRNWVMEIHYSCIRNNNSNAFSSLGADTGYDSISFKDSSGNLVKLLNSLEAQNCLPKTIIFSLNPNDNAMIGSAIGCFQSDEIKGKIQHGSAWWFNDTKDGMTAQIKNLANFSSLGAFVGMLTDSRSLLSYTRHEYFRRILCNIIGSWVENGEYPNDFDTLSEIIKNICYYNAKSYFDI